MSVVSLPIRELANEVTFNVFSAHNFLCVAKSVFQTSVGCLSDDNRYMTPRKLYFVEFAKY